MHDPTISNTEETPISLPEYRQLLGPDAETLSDAEVEHIRQRGSQLAAALFEWWLRKRTGRLSELDSHESGSEV